MKKLPFVLSCLVCAVASVRAQTGSVSVVMEETRTVSLLNENQDQFQAVVPPSTNSIYIHKVQRALPVDFSGFDTNITSELYADMVSVNSNLYPIYTVFIKEERLSRDRVLFNSFGSEVWRKPAPDGYMPYTFMLNLFMVDSIFDVDPFYRIIFDPAHIALEIYLIPEVFYDDYVADVAAENPPPEPIEPQPVTALTVGVQEQGGEDVSVKAPIGFEGLFDISATTDLTDTDWTLVLVGEITGGTTNLVVKDEDPLAPDTRFFRASPAEFDTDGDQLPDAYEYLVFGTNAEDPDGDGDGILDGDETHSDGSFGDLDMFLTDPFSPDTAAYALPTPSSEGPSASLAGFPVFDPPAFGDAAENTPVIAEWTRRNNPGDTMALTGELLSDAISGIDPDLINALPEQVVAGVEGSDSRFIFFAHTEEGRVLGEGNIQRLDGRQAAVTLPKDLPDDMFYLMWPHNRHGFGAPIPVNGTELWWANDLVSVGGSMRVFGRNLTLGSETSNLYIEELDLWLESESANPYMAEYTLPESMGVGTYTIYAHNGQGREYGWSTPVQVEVWEGYGYSDDQDTWYDVTDYGLVGDGETDNQGLLNDLWWTVVNNDEWPTIYFPPGDYRFGGTSSSFTVADGDSKGVRFKGAGADESVLSFQTVGDNTQSIRFQKPNSVFEDIRLETLPTGIEVISWGISLWSDADNIWFNRVTISGLPMQDRADRFPISFDGNEHMRFTDCDFYYNKPVDATGGYDHTYENCSFRGLLDSGSMSGGSIVNFALVDCNAKHYDDSDTGNGHGWGKGRWFVSGLRRASANWYIGGNVSTNMQPRVPEVEYTGTVLEVQNNYSQHTLPSGQTWNSSLLRLPPYGGLEDVEFGVWPDAARVEYGDSSYETFGGNAETGWIEILHEGTGNYEANQVVGIKESVNFNAGEQFMKEGGQSIYRGVPTDATEDTVTFSDLSSYVTSGGGGQSVVVVSGKGLGQSRFIVDVSGNTAILDKPWRVQPDSTSGITIGQYGTQWALYDNYMHADLAAYVNGLDSASAGIQFSAGGGGHSVVVENNVFDGVDRGFALDISSSDAFSSSVNTVSPWFFGRVEGNRFKRVITDFLDLSHAFPDTGSAFEEDAMFLGAVFRNNNSENAVGAVFQTAVDVDTGYLTVWDKNRASDFAVLDDSNYRRYNEVWVGNVFEKEGGEDLGLRFLPDRDPALNNNEAEGFLVDYPEGPGGIIELPNRVIDAVASSMSVELWNSGTEPMYWLALEASPWLTLTANDEGTVAEEVDPELSLTVSGGIVSRGNTNDLLSFDIDLSAAEGQSHIIVIANGRAKLLTVNAETGEGVQAAYTLTVSDTTPANAVTLYDHPDADSLRTLIRDWIDGDAAHSTRIAEVAESYKAIPNWKVCGFSNIWKAWRTFLKDWIRTYENRIRTYEYRNIYSREQPPNFWVDWKDFWSEWQYRRAWMSSDESVHWYRWRSFWKNERRWSRCDAWDNWAHLEYWEDFWADRRNWRKCRSWDDWKVCWEQYLIERKTEALIEHVENWLEGRWDAAEE